MLPRMDGLLTIICAYDDTDKDLLNGWILKCEDATVTEMLSPFFGNVAN